MRLAKEPDEFVKLLQVFICLHCEPVTISNIKNPELDSSCDFNIIIKFYSKIAISKGVLI